MSEPKDAFDLLEYPCDFQFKAMVRVSGLSDGESAEAVMQALVSEQVETVTIHSTTSNSSRTGRFESVTLSLTVPDRATLEAVYEALAAHEHVVMTL